MLIGDIKYTVTQLSIIQKFRKLMSIFDNAPIKFLAVFQLVKEMNL